MIRHVSYYKWAELVGILERESRRSQSLNDEFETADSAWNEDSINSKCSLPDGLQRAKLLNRYRCNDRALDSFIV